MENFWFCGAILIGSYSQEELGYDHFGWMIDRNLWIHPRNGKIWQENSYTETDGKTKKYQLSCTMLVSKRLPRIRGDGLEG